VCHFNQSEICSGLQASWSLLSRSVPRSQLEYMVRLSSVYSKPSGKFAWSVASLNSIAAQHSIDGRFMCIYHFGDLSLVLTHFQQGRKLVALFSDRLCVGSHECSPDWLGLTFDLVVREALRLPWLSSLIDHKSCTR
jgi:hypothetical protein